MKAMPIDEESGWVDTRSIGAVRIYRGEVSVRHNQRTPFLRPTERGDAGRTTNGDVTSTNGVSDTLGNLTFSQRVEVI